MPANAMKRTARTTGKPAQPVPDVSTVITQLKRLGSKRTLDGMARYGLPSDHAFGVAVGDIRALAKRLGRGHALAAALWDSGWYEARMLAAFVDEPELVTPAQMDRWAADFDNWGICDTVCFHLFDRVSPEVAFRKVAQWAGRKDEFVKRAAFALLASLAGHDKASGDEPFAKCLPLIERAAADDRNFVKKGVSWALRGVGQRSPGLHAASVALAERLAGEDQPASSKWVGRDALCDLKRPVVARRLAARSGR